MGSVCWGGRITHAMHSGSTLGPLCPSSGALHLGPSKLFTPLEVEGSALPCLSANLLTRLSILRSPMLYLSLTDAPQRTRSYVPVMQGFLHYSRAFHLPPAQWKSADSLRVRAHTGRKANELAPFGPHMLHSDTTVCAHWPGTVSMQIKSLSPPIPPSQLVIPALESPRAPKVMGSS